MICCTGLNKWPEIHIVFKVSINTRRTSLEKHLKPAPFGPEMAYISRMPLSRTTTSTHRSSKTYHNLGLSSSKPHLVFLMHSRKQDEALNWTVQGCDMSCFIHLKWKLRTTSILTPLGKLLLKSRRLRVHAPDQTNTQGPKIIEENMLPLL